MATPLSPEALSYYAQMGIPVPQQAQPDVSAYAPQPMQQQPLRPFPARQEYVGLIQNRMNELIQQAGGAERVSRAGLMDIARQKAMEDVAMIYGPAPEIEKPIRVESVEGINFAIGPTGQPMKLPTAIEKQTEEIGLKKSLFDLQKADQDLRLTQQKAQVEGLDRALKLQSSLASSANALTLIDGLLIDPDLSAGVGFNSVKSIIPATKAKELASRINQIKGDVFLRAYEGLKGGGGITEIEGKKAEQALARLDPAMSVDDFKKALSELRQTYVDFTNRASAGLQSFIPQDQQNQPGQMTLPQIQAAPAAPAEPMRVQSPGAVKVVRDPTTGRLIRQQ